MKVSREQVVENRRRILDAAGRLFKAQGFEAVTVAQVMKAAGLTHGGFYGHFKSKEDLVAQTISHVLNAGAPKQKDLSGYAAFYLSSAHRDDVAGGCPVASLATETVRQNTQTRTAMTEGLKRQIATLSKGAPGESEAEKRRAAIRGWAAMVGALVLARMSNDPALSDEVLAAAQSWIEEV